VADVQTSGVAYVAHVGGFIFGALQCESSRPTFGQALEAPSRFTARLGRSLGPLNEPLGNTD
jgi:hypothetical protein